MSREYWFNKGLIALLMWALAMPVLADNGLHSHPVQHYVNIHVAGGALMSIAPSTSVDAYKHPIEIRSLLGADANLGFSYEMRYRKFFFNIGVEADYDLARMGIDHYTDLWSKMKVASQPETDLTVPVKYYYNHAGYREAAPELRLAVPLQFGINFTPYFYGAIGIKGSVMVMDSYHAQSDITTTVMVQNAVGEFGVQANTDQGKWYGVYTENRYTYRRPWAPETAFQRLLPMLHPTLELGGRFPIASRVNMRVGLYAEYAAPLVSAWDVQTNPHMDYSSVTAVNGKMSQANLQSHLVMNQIRDNDMTAVTMNYTIGVRLTFNFNVTRQQHWCNCDADDD